MKYQFLERLYHRLMDSKENENIVISKHKLKKIVLLLLMPGKFII